MTVKEQLIHEIQSMPEDLILEILDFASFIKNKRQLIVPNQATDLSYRPASGRSILRHTGTWQGIVLPNVKKKKH